MDRITNKQLQYFVNELNTLTNSPMKPWVRESDRNIGQIGNFHLYGAYGSTALHRTMNEGGGVTEVFGLSTKRELYDKMRAMIKGLQLANELKGA
jgi:hypothetical protein